MIVRIIKKGEWEVVAEIANTVLSQEEVARSLRRKGMSARRVGREVHVEVPA